jgi:hypothetical protein
MPLPRLVLWPLPSNAACARVEMGPTPFTLEGSPSAGVYGLLASGRRVRTEWPPGYFATFDPSLAIHAPDGSIIAMAGQDLTARSVGGLFICTGGGPGGPDDVVAQFLPF